MDKRERDADAATGGVVAKAAAVVSAVSPVDSPLPLPERVRAVRGLAAAGVALWAVAFFVVRQRGSWEVLVGVAPLLAIATASVSRRTRTLLTPRRSDLAIGLAAGLVAVAATYGAFALVAPRAPAVVAEMAGLYALLRAAAFAPWASGICILVVAVCEEVIFRGPVLSLGVARRRELLVAAGLAVIVALAHAPLGSALLCLTVFVAGLGWSALRVATGRLVAPIVCHVVWDLAVIVLWPVA